MMFTRLLWHLLRGNRVRLTVALVALISAGAVISALMNLEMGVSRKLAQEFRSLGANLVVSAPSAPADASGTVATPLIDVSVMHLLESSPSSGVLAAPFLYLAARVDSTSGESVVLAGTWLDRAREMFPWWRVKGAQSVSRADLTHCWIGRNVSQSLGLALGSELPIQYGTHTINLTVAAIVDAGGSADNQVFVNLPVTQALAGADGKAQFIEISVPGSTEDIRAAQNHFQSILPALSVKPIPQITEAEGNLLRSIRFLILSTGILILVLTLLCILATMTALAMERRKDVGLMKALGGSMRKVLRIFFAEVGILALAGGVVGYALGMILCAWMGQRVFGASIMPRWEVLPATLALMLLVTFAGALPLRFLGNIRPAVILRGE